VREVIRRRVSGRSGTADRGRADEGRADKGLTLIELLVTMVIFSVVMATAYKVLNTVQRQSTDIAGREDTVGNARLATEQMDRQIRSGNVLYDPLLETLPMSMRVYTQVNGDQRCVQWQVYNGTLRSRSWSPTWQTDGIVSSWGIVARHIVNTVSTPPFALEGGSTAYGSRLLNISLRVQAATAKGNAVEVQTSLSGRNTLYGYDPGVCTPVPAA